ncbi:MAG: HDOD domain-containing protein [Acidobacteria bacterium]|nr:HDOD domain-containing protein [Acidobacteriota bacterium]
MISECTLAEPITTPTAKIDIDEIVKTNVPMMRGSAARISSLLNDINVSSRNLTEAISYDPILTARILRLANSPIYSLQKNVSTLRQAIDVVGMKSIYEILIIGLAADSFAREIRDSDKGRKIWEHSLAVALLSRELGRLLGLRGTEEAFICGLLHDIGKILLLRADFGGYSMLLNEENETTMLQCETSCYGYTHAQIGSLVANRWGLPDGVCHTILNHHNPSQAEQFAVIAHLICAADMISNLNGFGVRDSTSEFPEETESTIMLNLSNEQMDIAWANTLDNIIEITNAFA